MVKARSRISPSPNRPNCLDYYSATPSWLVSLSLVLITLLILSILYQLIYPTRVLDTFDAFESFGQPQTSDLTYVYMEGCGHCQRFDPTWREFTNTYKQALQSAGIKVHRLRNDDTEAKGLANHGFPTVVLISRGGDFADTTFDGQRTVQGLAAFVSKTIPSFDS